MNLPARCLALAALLTSSLALAGPAVLLSPVIGRTDSVVLQGRVLKEAPTKGSSVLSRNLRRLTAPNWKGAKVEVSFLGVTTVVTSGHDGAFEVNLQPPQGTPFPSGFYVAEAKVAGASARARVEVVADTAPFLVISDFDDTLAISHVIRPTKLMENALLKDSDTQEVVPGMSAFYGCLKAPTSPSFALVSGSPVQYGARIGDFLGRHSFPAFGLYLRDLGPSTLSNYKQPVIRRLLRQFSQPVVLVGDSGEKDPEIYAQIREEFPGRVKAIYIRNAGRTENASRFTDMILFGEAREAAEHAAKNGLADAACVAGAFPAPVPSTAESTTP
ncbi:phosphatidate phosphatase App1 family protein [Hyalangium rubrum]|uniref:Phosphatase domain-containing protein n=1 Tax=Hyalangium rubrum TaxID=3103134 RepID=A0ABU5H5S5_9BACT|nr:phosphatase domain-containing protein [Hyalangium sp. s54d21]MDY7228656.1 phosphatase domain-containing protein [Hyalangium sp. s54d21]